MAYLDEQAAEPVVQRFLDMLSLKPQLKEEVHSALRKLPEMKLRPEKTEEDEDLVNIVSQKSDEEFPYLDPIPPCMLHVDIRELSSVDIDWKMLTLERPENPLEVDIFNRFVYLDKVTVSCIKNENIRREREKSIRLRTKGHYRSPQENEPDKADEFTYDYFSRLFGANRDQPAEEVPKPAPPVELKKEPSPPPEKEPQREDSLSQKMKKPQHLFRKKNGKTKLRKKRGKKKRRSKKPKLLKKNSNSLRSNGQKLLPKRPLKRSTNVPKRTQNGYRKKTKPDKGQAAQLKSTRAKEQNAEDEEKSASEQPSTGKTKRKDSSNITKKKRSDSSKTLVQMLKASEKEIRKKTKTKS
ncbi:activating signal cointegrator 1 complex subunit 2 homolog [Uloborus diversus]|uniref:activating signal cointegrator 1 complex subunit 2 homolog n=1 Tax=Uloborus diversus TaxID=327109 RepID=UPI002409CDA8|nr:activating signal cointegrator 1 complex subunit 2 homolog [Uloborus diversus]